MPRSPRIEYEGACYHLMARGNRREPIVFSDSDRRLFMRTLNEVALRSGWEVFAWVLMDNHYHLVVRTPEPNLVSGMTWFQNAYTRRLNACHDLWGHLFGGRYRSILIEDQDYGSKLWRNYLRTVIDYVHLNPGRAGLVDGVEKTAAEYPWSSLAQGYQRRPSQRPKWLAVATGLDIAGDEDTVAGRKRYVERYDEWIRGDEKFSEEVDGVSLSARVRRGWYWGGESFKEKVLERIEREEVETNRNYQSSPMSKDHREGRAMEVIEEAERHFGRGIEELRERVSGDWTRAAIAWGIWQETLVSQSWIAERLNLKSAANASQQIRRFVKVDDKDLPREIRSWRRSRSTRQRGKKLKNVD